MRGRGFEGADAGAGAVAGGLRGRSVCARDVADLGSARGARNCVLGVCKKRDSVQNRSGEKKEGTGSAPLKIGRRGTGGCPSAFTARSEICRDRCSWENFNRRVCEMASGSREDH
jgi:hypothetical protein